MTVCQLKFISLVFCSIHPNMESDGITDSWQAELKRYLHFNLYEYVKKATMLRMLSSLFKEGSCQA
jgi:hypothetical protein